jgi:error-prone DNA polymerase
MVRGDDRGAADRKAAAWTSLNELRSMEVCCRHHPASPLRAGLARAGVTTAAGLKGLPDGEPVRAAGRKILINTPPTRSGRRVMFVTLEDETGLVDVVVFEDLQRTAAESILTSDHLAVEGTLRKQGPVGRSVTVTAHRLLTRWCGRLTELLLETARRG